MVQLQAYRAHGATRNTSIAPRSKCPRISTSLQQSNGLFYHAAGRAVFFLGPWKRLGRPRAWRKFCRLRFPENHPRRRARILEGYRKDDGVTPEIPRKGRNVAPID